MADSIFELGDTFGIESPFGNWLKHSGGPPGQGTGTDLYVTRLNGPSIICPGAVYEYRITGFNRADFVLNEVVSKVKWGYSIDNKAIIPIHPRADGVIGKQEIRIQWQVPRSMKGTYLKMHAWIGNQEIAATTSAYILAYPFLFHKYREKGKNVAGTGIADDMCYGDGETVTDHFRYNRTEIESLGALMQLTLQFDIPTLWAAFRGMVANLFSVGELERVALAMVARFEKNTGGEFSDPVLTKHIMKHSSTVGFIQKVEDGIRRRLKESGGNPVILFNPTVHRTPNDYGRPIFGTISDTFAGGLTICWNDTWAYEISIEQFDRINDDYLLTYKISLFDHFGLDITDLAGHPLHYSLAGFRAWFALQHIHSYRPFITTATIARSITGHL